MSRRQPQHRLTEIRQRLAQEAARILAEEGRRDFFAAKRKAAERLGIRDAAHVFPNNREIEAALGEYHRLFYADSQPRRLRELREAAFRAMQLFNGFEPRLTGPVLAGTATLHAEVQLHLFTDVPERIPLHLLERNIPHENAEKRLRGLDGAYRNYPVFRFMAGDIPIEAVVFPYDAIREAPASPVDGRPMRRAPLHEVESLLTGEI